MRYSIFIFFVLISFVCAAQNNLQNNYFTTTLDNGMQIGVLENPLFPIAHIEIGVKDGPVYESDSSSGLAFLTQMILMNATQINIDPAVLKAKLKQLGIQSGSTAAEDYSSYYFNLPLQNMDAGMKLLNEMIQKPAFLQQDIQNAIPVLLNKMGDTRTSAEKYINDNMLRYVWGNDYSRKSLLGNHDVISKATTDQLLQNHDLFYVPNNMFLFVTGNVNHADVFAKANAIFGSMHAGQAAEDISPQPTERPIEYNSHFVTESPTASSPVFLFTFNAPDIQHAVDACDAGKILANILTQTNSYLYNRLVRNNLALQVAALYDPERFGSTFNIVMLPNPDYLQESLDTLIDAINQLKFRKSFTQNQIDRAINDLTTQYDFANTKPTDLAENILKAWSLRTPYLYFNEKNMLQEVSLNDVADFAADYLSGQSSVQGLLISSSQRQGLHVDSFFIPNKYHESYLYLFDKNETDFNGVNNRLLMRSMLNFLKLNPSVNFNVAASQDATEKKGAAQTRFQSIYSLLLDAGIDENRLRKMQVGVYINHGATQLEVKNNQFVQINLVK
jgi:zinc protease